MRVFLKFIGNGHIACEFSIDGDHHYRFDYHIGFRRNINTIGSHQCFVADQDLLMVDYALQSLTGNFRNFGCLKISTVRFVFQNCLCNGVGGLFFHRHLVFHKFHFRKSGCIYHFLNLKDPFGNGSGFVHHHSIHFGHCIEKGCTFEQDSVARCRTKTAEIAQWNGNDQGTRAGNHQEN